VEGRWRKDGGKMEGRRREGGGKVEGGGSLTALDQNRLGTPLPAHRGVEGNPKR
jgi:hypothetical protein